MCSCGIAFVLADVAQSVLKVSSDVVANPIANVACQSCRLTMRLASQLFDCYSDWVQVSFTTRYLGAYLEGTIRTRRETSELTTLLGSFQGHLAVAAL